VYCRFRVYFTKARLSEKAGMCVFCSVLHGVALCCGVLQVCCSVLPFRVCFTKARLSDKTDVCVCVCKCMCIYVCMYMFMYVCIAGVCVYLFFVFVCGRQCVVHVYVCMHVHIYYVLATGSRLFKMIGLFCKI